MGAGGVADDQQPYSGDALIGVAAAIAAVQILFVAARFYTRFMLRTKVGLDDYLVLLALVCMQTIRLIRESILTRLFQIASLGKSALYITSMLPRSAHLYIESNRTYTSQLSKRVEWAITSSISPRCRILWQS
jgi:hypothetical protein